MLQFKVKTVGVHLEVICSGFYEEPVLDFPLEDDGVKVPRLAVLAPGRHVLLRN